MSRIIRAEVIKGNILRPLEKLHLEEGERVVIKIFDGKKTAALQEEVAWNRLAIEQFFTDDDADDSVYDKL